MSFGGVIFALTAVQAVQQIGQGYAQKAEAKYNATLLEGKSAMIDVEKDIQYGQYQREKSQVLSKSMANVASMGIQPTGSAAAVMLDAQTQMTIDQAIGQFNLEQEKQYTQAQADSERRRGAQAVYSGYSKAFTTILSGTQKYASYTMAKNSQFDFSTKLPKTGGAIGGGRD